uniref:Myb-like domain-containing protein n=2 Tax=Schistocephalus solidus TaxID=70667 RepID=A0A0X3PWR6_SCHSO
MSNTELALLATTFSIIIHFAALWGHTLEKRWMLHERLETHYKRHKASDKRKIAIDAEIAEQLKEIASPTLWDILPIYLIRVFFNFIRSIPSFISFVIKFIKDLAEEKKRTKEEIKELERLEEERKLRKTLKKKQPGKLPKNRLDVDVSLMATFSPDNLKVSTDELSETDDRPINTKDWTPDEEAIFIRLTNKYPGGFPNRWRKIAEVLGRSVADVTARASAISARMSERMQLNPDFESDAANASDAEREDSDDYYLSKRKAKRLGKAPKIAVPKVETAEDDEDGGGKCFFTLSYSFSRSPSFIFDTFVDSIFDRRQKYESLLLPCLTTGGLALTLSPTFLEFSTWPPFAVRCGVHILLPYRIFNIKHFLTLKHCSLWI